MVSQEEMLEQLNTQIKIEEEKKTMEQDLKNYKLMLEFNSRRIFPGWNLNHATEEKRRALVENSMLKQRQLLESRSCQYDSNTTNNLFIKPKTKNSIITGQGTSRN